MQVQYSSSSTHSTHTAIHDAHTQYMESETDHIHPAGTSFLGSEPLPLPSSQLCAHNNDCPPPQHTHAHAHTHTNIHTHTYTHTNIHTHTYTHTHAHAHTHTQDTQTHKEWPGCLGAAPPMCPATATTNATVSPSNCPPLFTRTHTHAQTNINTRTHTRTHTHARTHAHTYTYKMHNTHAPRMALAQLSWYALSAPCHCHHPHTVFS